MLTIRTRGFAAGKKGREVEATFVLFVWIEDFRHFEREQRRSLLLRHDGIEELGLGHTSVVVLVHLLKGGESEGGLVLARLSVLIAEKVKYVLDNLLQFTHGDDPIPVSVEAGNIYIIYCCFFLLAGCSMRQLTF